MYCLVIFVFYENYEKLKKHISAQQQLIIRSSRLEGERRQAENFIDNVSD